MGRSTGTARILIWKHEGLPQADATLALAGPVGTSFRRSNGASPADRCKARHRPGRTGLHLALEGNTFAQGLTKLRRRGWPTGLSPPAPWWTDESARSRPARGGSPRCLGRLASRAQVGADQDSGACAPVVAGEQSGLHVPDGSAAESELRLSPLGPRHRRNSNRQRPSCLGSCGPVSAATD